MNPITLTNQKGIGLIEVLVALLILAAAILGFSAMQMNAIRTTDEGVMRSRAMAVMRSGAEIMRANKDNIEPFQKKLNTITSKNETAATACKTGPCNATQLAESDAQLLYNYAVDNEVQVGMNKCPGTSGNQERQCMIVSWGGTSPKFGADAETACADDSKGIYYSKANCFIVEAY